MGVDRIRVLVLGGVSLVLFVVATIFVPWFDFRIGPITGSIDLRSVHVCDGLERCASVAMTKKNGFSGSMYVVAASAAFWMGLGFAALVGFQTVTRTLTGSASEGFTKYGYLLGASVFAIGGSAAYLFGFDIGDSALVTVTRTWAPLLYLAASIVGMFALYYAVDHDYDMAAPQPLPEARARVPFPQDSRPIHNRAATIPPAPAAVAGQTGPTLQRATTPIPVQWANQLAYAAVIVELTGGGLDARRDDRTSVLVLWRDVVGVVARRLPPDYDGATFVDVVSTAGSTVRILPWTRVTGLANPGDGEARARAVVEMVAQKNPGVRIDPATKAFIGGRAAAQLPDLATLAAHDERLA